jgi:hypothetical protein
MIYFFHHYEMPLIVHQQRLHRIIIDLQHNQTPPPPPSDVLNDRVETADINSSSVNQSIDSMRSAGEQTADSLVTTAINGALDHIMIDNVTIVDR